MIWSCFLQSKDTLKQKQPGAGTTGVSCSIDKGNATADVDKPTHGRDIRDPSYEVYRHRSLALTWKPVAQQKDDKLGGAEENDDE